MNPNLLRTAGVPVKKCDDVWAAHIGEKEGSGVDAVGIDGARRRICSENSFSSDSVRRNDQNSVSVKVHLRFHSIMIHRTKR
jgi:hypothetical protein